jgi:hypothetical protein
MYENSQVVSQFFQDLVEAFQAEVRRTPVRLPGVLGTLETKPYISSQNENLQNIS